MQPREDRDDDDLIRERLHKLLAERSQSEIARKTGSQVAAVNRYVHGARIPASFCSSLVRGIGVNPSWLLVGEGSPFLADVPEQTAKLGENLLELVEAMSAVSRMLLGELTGKHHLKVLRELNDALLRHEQLRATLNERSRPVFERILSDFQKALDSLDRDRADHLRKAADQLSRLCDDETLTRNYLRACAYHEFQQRHSQRFLQTQRKLFLRSISDVALFNDASCDEGRRIVIALIQMDRVHEARKMCVALLTLAGEEGRNWPSYARLETALGNLTADSGRLYEGVALIQRNLPRLTGMHQTVAQAALARLLLWAGVVDMDGAAGIGPPSDAKAEHLLAYAWWTRDRANLDTALKYAAREDLKPVWRVSFFELLARAAQKQLARPGSLDLAELASKLSETRASEIENADLAAFTIETVCADLAFLGQDTTQATRRFRKAQECLAKLMPDVVPPPLELAGHYRTARELLADSKKKEDAELLAQAQEYFRFRYQHGYRIFEALA